MDSEGGFLFSGGLGGGFCEGSALECMTRTKPEASFARGQKDPSESAALGGVGFNADLWRGSHGAHGTFHA